MSGYGIALGLHSWLRWVVVVVLAVAFVRALWLRAQGRPNGGADKALRTISVASLHTQLLLGIVLYVISPVAQAARVDMGASMKNSGLRFFLVEHPFGMIVALVVAMIFSVRARKATTDAEAQKRVAIGFGLALLIILISIPWPGLPYGRALFRF